MKMGEKPVTSRDELIRVIFELMDDHDSEGSRWENKNIHTFLEAMAAWLNDAAGYYRNSGQNVDVEKPSWQLFADALSAASVYE